MMEGWKEIALNEIGWFKGAGVNKLINTDEQPVYLVNYMDVYKHWRIFYNTNYQEVTAKDREIEEANLLEGDVLFTPSSEKPIDIGHAGVVMETMPNCVYSYHLIRLRLYDKTQFDLKFLSYLLNSDEVQKHFVSRASGSGIRYTLSLSDFKSAKIRFPEKHEQSAIAAILSKVDEAIAAVQASISAAERLKKSLMQNLLTGRMKPDGTLRTEDEFYLDEKFGKVPVGWEMKKVKNFGEVITGKTPPTEKPDVFSDKEHGFMFVTPGDVDTAKYIEQTERYVSEKGIKYSYTLPQNAVCVICIGSTIGKIGITTKECCTNQQITSVIVNDDNVAEFFYYAMSARKDHFKSVAGINATPQINKSEYSKYRILCPKTKAEQIEIAQKLGAIDTEINKKQNKIAVLERLKKSLMQNLLTGKVNVQ